MKARRREIPQTAEFLSLLFALLLVLFVAMFAHRAWAAFSLISDQRATTLLVFDGTNALLSSLKDAETGQRGFLLTGEDRYLEPYRQALTTIPATLKSLDRIEVDRHRPDQAQRIDRLMPLVKDKLDELGQTIEVRRSSGVDAALAIVRTDRGRAAMDQIRGICSEIQTVSSDLLTRETEIARASANRAGLVGTLGSAAVFVLLLLSTVTIQRGTGRRQQLIEALQKSEEQAKQARDWLQTTLGSIGDGVIATDASGNVTLLNAVAQSLTGWTQEEAAAKPLEEIFIIRNEETGAAVESPVTKVIREGRIAGLANHTRLTAKNGHEIPIDDSAAPIRDAEGNIAGVVLVFRDVSSRKEIEQTIQRSVARFQLMADNAPVLIWMAGLDKRCNWFNKPWLDFVRRTMEQELGDGWSENVHPDDLDRCRNTRLASFDARQPFTLEYRLKRHDGEYRWVLENGTPLFGETGESTGYIGSCIDITDRKEIEKVLRGTNEALQEFAQIVDPVVVLVRDTKDYIIRWSSGAQTLYGFTAAEAVGKVSHDLFQTQFPEPLEQIRAQLLATGRWEGELRHKAPNGSEIIVASVWVLHRDKQGAPSAILEVNSDITLRKKAEEALRESEARYRHLSDYSRAVMNNLAEGLYTMDTDGRVTFLNPAAEEMFGWTTAELLGKTMHDATHYKHADGSLFPASECAIRRVLKEGGELRSHEDVFTRRDGSPFPVVLSASPIVAGRETIGIVIAFRDDTDRRKAEAALRESEERFRTLANHMSQFAWMTDETGWIFWYNQRWYDYTGTTIDEMQGWGWRKVHHPEHVDRVVEHISHCFQTGEVWEDTFPLRGKDGNFRWFLSRAHPITNAEGKIVRWFGTNTDITEQLATETELRRANDDLSQFAFAASHDLQEPLRMITSYSQLLVKGYRGQLEKEASICVGFITEGTKRMRALLADLLAYTQLTGDARQPVESVNLNQVFDKVIENCKPAIEESKATVTSDRLPIIRGHEPHFLQLFQNLVSNAIKYRGEREPRVHISAATQDGAWRFAVADNGIGIDPEYHQKIFGVFKRLHGKTIPGTGIGLAICQRVVQRYGGRIWVKSQGNQGATFYFILPATKEAGS